ncbi:hypothetical protein SAMN05216252_13580 [Actinacidiphila glaucinigra]|uniref:Uncharacterized protein n=1 Tax=Actinacidiphila glaucinigra TaxID=235986 RepID=A0A239NGW2_9ACTN|nr:hypothetical protein SAMN05216252_13580 [Actinacidiphila glaucinigra]
MAGQALAAVQCQSTVRGEDLGAWVQAQRLGCDGLLSAQVWTLQNMLHPESAGPDEAPSAPRTRADKWSVFRAARQCHAREGSLPGGREAH